MRKCILAVALMALCCFGAGAQGHEHGTITGVVEINGQEHPEAIPDAIAYHNFFFQNSVLSNASTEERERQGYKIARLGLAAQDELQLRLELSNYRAKFEAFNASYTERASKGLSGPHAFWAGVTRLVSETRANLQKDLTQPGHEHFEQGVQNLRARTRYFTGTGGVL